MLGTIGFILSLAVLIFLSFKGYNSIITSIAAALILGLTNGFDAFGIYTDYYMPGLVGFIRSWFLIFVLGAVFSEILTQSGSVSAVAYKLLECFGKKNAVIVIAAITAILTIGGVNPYVQIFIVWPICMVFSREADIPRGIWIAVHYLGMFAAYSFPGNPGMANVILSEGLAVSGASKPLFSLLLFAINFLLGIAYFSWRTKSWKKKGVHYIANPADEAGSENAKADCPNIIVALSPMIVLVAVYIAITSDLIPAAADFSSSNAILLAMLIGCILCIGLNYKRLSKKLKDILIKGSSTGVNPAITAGVITGYLSVFTSSPVYSQLIALIENIGGGAFIQAFIAANVITFITGSGTVAATPVVAAFKASWTAMGVDMGAMRSVLASSVAGASISPHSGGLSGVLGFTKSTLKESYEPIFFGVACVSLLTSLIGAILAGFIF